MAVPVPAVPIKEAIEKMPTDVPAAPNLPAKAFVIFWLAPFSSLVIASTTSSQAIAVFIFQLSSEMVSLPLRYLSVNSLNLFLK